MTLVLEARVALRTFNSQTRSPVRSVAAAFRTLSNALVLIGLSVNSMMGTDNTLDVMNSQVNLSDASTNKTETFTQDSEPITLFLASSSATFVKRGKQYVPVKQHKLKNSLLTGVGFLELANAGDFAANVWNDIPVPTFAVVLMAIGGTLALSISYFAFKDSGLSWNNVRILREERYALRKEKDHRVHEGQMVQDLDTWLDVNFRELGTELISRFCVDILMGFGAVIIGLGTLMAIDGANRHVWYASNLLSGYIGNAPLAFYAMVNGAWSLYLWIKAYQHNAAGAKALNGGPAATILKHRFRNVRIYVTVNGITTLLGGAGSLISATMWYGYMILIPVIISSVCCNYFWRHRVGYDRPVVRNKMSERFLVSEIEFVASVQHLLEGMPPPSLRTLVSDPQSVASVVDFIVANDLFEDFCAYLLRDANLSITLFGNLGKELTINSQNLSMADEQYYARILEIAQTCINKKGKRSFQFRGRYLAETLGSYLCITQAKAFK